MKNENILWGNGKIQGELLKLGIELDRRTTHQIIADFRILGRIQNGITWSKFIKSHVDKSFCHRFFHGGHAVWEKTLCLLHSGFEDKKDHPVFDHLKSNPGVCPSTNDLV